MSKIRSDMKIEEMREDNKNCEKKLILIIVNLLERQSCFVAIYEKRLRLAVLPHPVLT
jgi:hypothetical protein